MSHIRTSTTIALVTVFVYALNSLSATKSVVNSLFVLYIFVASAGILYWPIARKNVQSEFILNLYHLAVFVSILMWVGVTGWFFSPFFYFLYLIAIMIAFVYSPFQTFVFVTVLLGLFAPHIGSIDLTLDIITVASLFTVVPLTYFLQKEYLLLKQAEKKVLVLEEETSQIKNKVDELLLNKVVKMAVDIRQPINDIRQLALHALKKTKDAKAKETLHKIIVLGQESLDQVETFEERVTGKKLLHSKSKK